MLDYIISDFAKNQYVLNDDTITGIGNLRQFKTGKKCLFSQCAVC